MRPHPLTRVPVPCNCRDIHVSLYKHYSNPEEITSINIYKVVHILSNRQSDRFRQCCSQDKNSALDRIARNPRVTISKMAATEAKYCILLNRVLSLPKTIYHTTMIEKNSFFHCLLVGQKYRLSGTITKATLSAMTKTPHPLQCE